MEACDYVEDLGAAGGRAWDARVAAYVEEAVRTFASQTTVLCSRSASDSTVTAVEWTGFPERVASCLTRRETLQLLDAGPGGTAGRALQEEYVEWRVVECRSQIQRIEMTTELPEYWALLAAYNPRRVLSLAAEFAGEERAAAIDIFGRHDAVESDVSPEERVAGFRAQMLEGASPYNDGRRAICCMRQQSNTLFSLIALAAAASTPQVIADELDGRIRPLRCDESVRLFRGGVAQLGRASDPLLVERLGQLAVEGREIALDTPVGPYIENFQIGRLLTPRGSHVPEEWFRFSRGAVGPDGRRRFRRLIFEVPRDEPFCVSDLIDVATEQPIEHGGDIADLINVVLFLRVSNRGTLPVPNEPVALPPHDPNLDDCSELRDLYSSFLSEAAR